MKTKFMKFTFFEELRYVFENLHIDMEGYQNIDFFEINRKFLVLCRNKPVASKQIIWFREYMQITLSRSFNGGSCERRISYNTVEFSDITAIQLVSGQRNLTTSFETDSLIMELCRLFIT